MEFGEYLKFAIKSAKLTNRKFAEKYGVSAAYISNIVKGKRLPSQEAFGRMIAILEPLITKDVYFQLTEHFAKEKLGINFDILLPAQGDKFQKENEILKKISSLSDNQRKVVCELVDEFSKLNRQK
ncbi:helix-turn-helix transcriptional regulator [Lentisphaerota bacterium WC36G]|nr:helix-turn-helix transcriptional regulator [Lentisphaerae bacterium WC36]